MVGLESRGGINQKALVRDEAKSVDENGREQNFYEGMGARGQEELED